MPAARAGASAAAGPLKATSAPAGVDEDVCGEAAAAWEQARAEGGGAEPDNGVGSGSGGGDRSGSPAAAGRSVVLGEPGLEGPAPVVVSLAQLHGGRLPAALEDAAAAQPAPRERAMAGAGVSGWSPDAAGAGRGEPEQAPGRAGPDQAPAGPSSAASAASSLTVELPAAGAPDRDRLPDRVLVNGSRKHGDGRIGQEAKALGDGPLQLPSAAAAAACRADSAASSTSHATGGGAAPVEERKQDAAELGRCITAGALVFTLIRWRGLAVT